MMGCVGSTCLQGDYTSIPDTHQNTTDVPVMRLCAPGKDSTYFADVGDTVVLYVDFGPNCSPCPLNDIGDTVDNVEAIRRATAAAMPSSSGDGHQERFNYEVMIAGVLVELTCLHPAVRDSKNYKASVKIPTERTAGILENGRCIPVRLPYRATIGPDRSEDRSEYQEMTQEAITSERDTVFFQSIWRDLKDHNLKNIRESVSRETSLLGRYGSLGHTSPIVGTQDQMDGRSDKRSSIEQQDVIVEGQRRARTKAKRYWPDSWQMKFWRRAGCDKIMRSNNPIARFIALFFVAPLVNVTGLSLHYQLYLSEIFHTRFWTRILHYLCMPFIVLMMMAFFAQWRFVIDNHDISCYRTGNVEVVILNGSMALGLALWFWYLIWGACQQTLLMGIFMIVPLFILYLLANIFFQVSIKNSLNNYPCTACWKHTSYSDGHIQYYKIFELVKWYYNPVIWAVVFSFMQALSHLFEPKIPPRVSQTAHWMSCSQMFKRIGYTRTLCILLTQAIFGTVDEFLASPRLLPIFVLRVCYEMGYHKKQWKWMKKLVKRCLQYGDPALDYIGTGGAEYLESTTVFSENVNIDTLKAELESMKLTLNDHQKQLLENPSLLSRFKRSGKTDNFLDHYIVLRHYVAQYILQVYAYGPFRSRGDEHQVNWDHQRMERDFGDNHSFRNFLDQVRDSLWQMEDDLLEKRSGSPCCRDVEEV